MLCLCFQTNIIFVKDVQEGQDQNGFNIYYHNFDHFYYYFGIVYCNLANDVGRRANNLYTVVQCTQSRLSCLTFVTCLV